MLTKKQKPILNFVTAFSKKHGYAPSLEEIKKHFRLRSISTVHQHLATLQDKGYLQKQKNQPRSIITQTTDRMIQIPLRGVIAAGQLHEAIENRETIAVPQSKLPFANGDYYGLRVSGDSMIEEDINDGDIVLVKKQNTAQNGEKVVALVDNTEATLKKFYKDKNHIRLQPANKTLGPIIIKKDTPFAIQGVVVDVIRGSIQAVEIRSEIMTSSAMPTSLPKPYYEMQGAKLYHADCLNILAILPENSVDMIFADPPYNLSNGGFSLHAGKRVSVNKGMWDKSKGFKDDYDFHHKWLVACKRVLKPEGTLWVSGTYHSIYQCGHALQALGYHILNDISWFKPNGSPNLSCRFFTASHETVIWARKDKKAKHTFNYPLMKNGDWPGDLIKKPKTQMRSVWAIYPPKKSEKLFGKHPTQKPVELLKRIVLASTKSGDLILDPFTGSSTTGIASCSLGRMFIGIDTESKYLDLSIKRFEAENMVLSPKTR